MSYPRITTSAPLPSLQHWKALFPSVVVEDGAIDAPWLSDGDTPFWFSRGAWALRALTDAGRAIKKRPLIVWVPDYFCNQALWLLRQTDIQLVFYPIEASLKPSWPDCEKIVSVGAPDLFLLVHYFGYATDPVPARQFCDEHGALLVEDAAHSLMPTDAMGRLADFTLHSQYKNLPLPDGGLLVVRPSAADWIAQLTSAQHVLTQMAPGPSQWVAKRLLQTILPGIASRMAPGQINGFDDDPASVSLPATAAMSTLAKRMLAMMVGELGDIASRRRANETALRTLFSGLDGLQPCFAVPTDNDIPYRAVFRAADHATARRWFDRFRATGNVVESWPDMPPEVQAAPERHEAAINLRATLLTFPVHADRTQGDLEAAYGPAC